MSGSPANGQRAAQGDRCRCRTGVASLPEQAEELGWKRKVDDLSVQIERLGTINLTAIEEFKSQSERMSFLNAQQADLIEACKPWTRRSVK